MVLNQWLNASAVVIEMIGGKVNLIKIVIGQYRIYKYKIQIFKRFMKMDKEETASMARLIALANGTSRSRKGDNGKV